MKIEKNILLLFLSTLLMLNVGATVPKKATPKKMDDLLLKIDRRLQSRVIKTDLQTTDLRTSKDASEYLRYQSLVRDKIVKQWVLPKEVVKLPEKKKPMVKVLFFIDKEGNVISKEIIDKSTIESLNKSVLQAVDKASPLPLPPERLKFETYNEGFMVEFNSCKKNQRED